MDDQDREFNYSSDATIYGASDGAVSLLDEINPGNVAAAAPEELRAILNHLDVAESPSLCGGD